MRCNVAAAAATTLLYIYKVTIQEPELFVKSTADIAAFAHL
jgi:hypothetical protein